ncbi:MAG: hypothetical protein HOB98_22565 [Gammaproteobacteria bacterium]|nr:hypothetical protein [Gammaproteobacteria bacterium]
MNTLSLLPLEFWIIVVLLTAGTLFSIGSIRAGTGFPLATVLATIAVWYLVEIFYNDDYLTYMQSFPPAILSLAWRQVVVFLAILLPFTFIFHRLLNARHRRSRSFSWELIRNGVGDAHFQKNLAKLLQAAIAVYGILLIGAVFRYQENFVYFLLPYMGKHPGPWLTSGLSSGTDSLLALANYLHMMVGAIFGVIAALSKDPRTRRIAIICIILSWPLYLFDRTRGFILILTIPGILAWVFIGVRTGLVRKFAILLVFFLMVNAWFGFIIASRSSGDSVTNNFLQRNFTLEESINERHQGINMFEELSWIIKLTRSGRYSPETGANYFANLVNPIPRFLWPSKPTIGIDYALARGLGNKSKVGVFATLSNGLIGQGVVNFGLYTGPIFAGLLMSLWVCFLAHLDLTGRKIGHTALYGLGLITTFPLGRDITFINLYPIFFGYLICRYLNYREATKSIKIKVASYS